MKGQMSIFDYPEFLPKKRNPKLDIPRAPIYHYSLNHVWEECPNCKAYNKASIWVRTWDGRDGFWKELERCPECGQLFDWSDEAIEKAAKKSKDYLEAERKQNGNIK